MNKQPTYKYILSDGGKRDSGYWTEQNDCTVRALAHFLTIPYPLAHTMLALAGRRMGKGFDLYHWLEQRQTHLHIARLEALEFRRGKFRPYTLGNFLRTQKQGVYLLGNRTHCYCVKDGVLIDSWFPGEKTRVQHVFVLQQSKGETRQ